MPSFIYKKISDHEFENIKKELKEKFPFVNVRRATQKTLNGGFNVMPKKVNNYRFTNEQAYEISKFLHKKGYYAGYKDLWEFAVQGVQFVHKREYK